MAIAAAEVEQAATEMGGIWAEAHQEEAQQIAKAGQQVALDNMKLEPFVKQLREKISRLAVAMTAKEAQQLHLHQPQEESALAAW